MKHLQRIKWMKKFEKLLSDDGIIKNVFESFCTVLILMIVIVVFMKEEFNIGQFLKLDMAITVSVTMLIAGMLGVVRKKLSSWLEDSTKLTMDYDELCDLYGTQNTYITYENTCDLHMRKQGLRYTSCRCRKGEENENPSYRFPVIQIFFNRDKMKFLIEDSQNMYELPDLVLQNYAKLFSFHSHSVVYNDLNIRLLDFKVSQEEKMVTLKTERTTYFNSLVTNRALDAPLAENLSLRKIFQIGKEIVPLNESDLSNHLGFSGFVETKDQYLIFVLRDSHNSIAKRMLGVSVGASLKTKYALEDKAFTLQGLKNGICQEILDELHLKEEDYHYCNEENIIAGYRDLLEGGKPQLLFYVKSFLDKKAFEKQFKSPVRKLETAKSGRQVEEKMKQDGHKLVFFPKSELKNIFVAPDCIVYHNKRYVTVPSASASLCMLIQYLCNFKS